MGKKSRHGSKTPLAVPFHLLFSQSLAQFSDAMGIAQAEYTSLLLNQMFLNNRRDKMRQTWLLLGEVAGRKKDNTGPSMDIRKGNIGLILDRMRPGIGSSMARIGR